MVSVNTCNEFANHFVCRIEHLASMYSDLHLVFDKFDEQSLKQRTREHCCSKFADSYNFAINDEAQIKVPLKKFLSSSKTKDKLTVYFLNKTLIHFEGTNKPIVTATTKWSRIKSV